MHQYKCERCGATLDPGERCDCQEAGNEPDKITGKLIRQDAHPEQPKAAAK